MDRALQAGIDVGVGALFGLAEYKFETLALLMHAADLDSKFGWTSFNFNSEIRN
jgi:2-iminoacetate synthase